MREKELGRVIDQVKMRSDLDMRAAKDRYDDMLQAKNAEIERFQRELSEIASAVTALRVGRQ